YERCRPHGQSWGNSKPTQGSRMRNGDMAQRSFGAAQDASCFLIRGHTTSAQRNCPSVTPSAGRHSGRLRTAFLLRLIPTPGRPGNYGGFHPSGTLDKAEGRRTKQGHVRGEGASHRGRFTDTRVQTLVLRLRSEWTDGGACGRRVAVEVRHATSQRRLRARADGPAGGRMPRGHVQVLVEERTIGTPEEQVARVHGRRPGGDRVQQPGRDTGLGNELAAEITPALAVRPTQA